MSEQGHTQKHELIGGTLKGTDKGVIARCVCGWTSGYRFTSLAASAAMMEHRENKAKASPQD